MRVMIFGCPHLQSGVTLGSAALPQTVAWLLETARNNSVTHIVCLGDTVDSVSKTDLIVNMQIKWTLDQFKTLAAQGVYTCWMIGNHDVYSDIYSGLDIFDQAANFNLVKNPTLLGGDDAELVLWPFQQWMDDPLQWRERTGGMYLQRTGEKPRILFTHCPIEGMPMGGTKDKGVDLKELALNFDMLFAGHYHQSNQFMAEAMSAETPVAVPGSVMGHDFKDLGWFHGALIWDYMPGSTDYPIGMTHWLQNPYSHYFYKGDSATLNTALQDPAIAALKDRLHVRLTDKVDSLQYRQYGIPTVQVRPKHEKRESSSQGSFKLEGDPVEDLSTWLETNGHDQTELLKLGRTYIA